LGKLKKQSAGAAQAAVSGASTRRAAPAAETNFGAAVGLPRRRGGLLLTTALLGGLMAVPGMAQAAAPEAPQAPSLAQAAQTWAFEIPAQDLAAALLAYAQATGIQVVFKSADLAGLATTGLKGEMTAESGLRLLLAQSGLTYEFASASSVVVRPLPRTATGEDGAVTLEGITVEGYRNITSYLPTEGYVSYYSVAATKSDTPVVETPQSISTVGRDEMDDRNVKTVAEAMRYTAGVTVDSYGVDPRGFDTIKIRGFDSVTTGSFRDGLRMDGNFFALYTTEPYGIERVDMMRGPSGALYGQAEAGGVIDRTTKRPRADMRQELRVDGGSWETLQGAFDLGGAITEDESLLFRLTGLGRTAHTEFDYNDGSHQNNDRLYFAPALTWNPDHDTSFTLLADYMNDHRPTAFGTLATEEVRTSVVAGEPGFDEFHQEQFALGYDFRHRFNDLLEFRQKARYTYVDVDYQGVSAEGFDPATGTIVRSVWSAPDTVHQGVIDNQLESRFELGPTFHVALFGLDYSHSVDTFSYHYGPADPLNINNIVYTGATVPEPYQRTEQTLQQAGAYLQDQITIYDNWILTLGGRFSYVRQETEDRFTHTSETKNDNAFTGRAGVTYLFDNGLAPYVSYTQGFTPQNGTTREGETFVPEESEQYEIGLKYEPKDFNALFTVAAFQLTKTDVLTVDPDDLFSSVQTGEVRTRGVELEAKATLMEGLDLAASYTFLDAKVTESNDEDLGKRPVNVPEHSAAAWLKYTFQDGLLEGLGIGGGLRYVGPTYNDLANDSENSSYLLVDAALDYDLNENLSFQVNANNLFDREYVTICNSGSCYYGTGLRVLAGMSYHW